MMIIIDTIGWVRWSTGIVQEIKIWPYQQWYIQNPASVLENNIYELLWDFSIQTDHLISARR